MLDNLTFAQVKLFTKRAVERMDRMYGSSTTDKAPALPDEVLSRTFGIGKGKPTE